MTSLLAYLNALTFVRSSGAGVAETSYYPALSGLLDAVGRKLSPTVRCVGQLANLLGAGSPDFGLYSADQFPRKADLVAKPAAGQKPGRGVVEAKGTAADVLTVAGTHQVAKYLQEHGVVLVTNYRDFLLVTRGPGGVAVFAERYTLAPGEAGFWTAVGQNAASFAARHEVRSSEFLRRALLHEAPLSRPQDVAFFMASYARHALRLLDERPDLPALRTVRTALEEALGVRFEDGKGEHFFRSTLVQTLFYGAFSAWVLWSRDNPSTALRFDWRLAAWSLRVPILRTLFVQIADPGRLKPLGLDQLLDWTSAALNRVDRAGFFAAFDAAGADAVQYFYEPFLAAFDPELRRQLGVWYTPREIVRYQVARVDQLLKTELGIADGLADPSVFVLDPCCGTGAYLVETLRRIEANLHERGDADALLASDLKAAARTRLFGFELIPAPFVVAHLQLGLLLAQKGAPLAEDERAAVFLTKALTGWEPPAAERAPLLFPELDAERNAAEEVKRDRPILVVLGNPPYNGFADIAPDETEERSEERDLSTAYRTPRRRPLLDPETPVPGVTSGTVEPSLRSVASLQTIGAAPLNPATDLTITAGWGHFGQGGAVMPGRGKGELVSRLRDPQTGEPWGPDDPRAAGQWWIFLNERAGWTGIPQPVWEYTLGGYQVLKKWLSYREEAVLGRPLRPDEAREFTAIARRIAALLALGADLDASYQACKAAAS